MSRFLLSDSEFDMQHLLSVTESESEYLRWIAGILHNFNYSHVNVASTLL